MATDAGTVGPVALPVAAGAADAPFGDIVARALGNYVAHWLNYTMSAKLEQMRPQSTPAVPVRPGNGLLNIGLYDPGTTFVREPLPALYVWSAGSKPQPYSTVRHIRSTEYHVRWYFAPLSTPGGANEWSGLLQTADRTMHSLSDDWRHQTFPPVGLTLDLDWPIGTSMEAALCLHDATLLRVITGMTKESPGQAATGATIRNGTGDGTDGARQRGFPTMHAVFALREFVSVGTADPLTDETPDIMLALGGTSEGCTPMPLVDRILQGPDGTDSPTQKG